MLLGDGYIGQMMEPVVFEKSQTRPDLPTKDWTLTGAEGRKARLIKTLDLDPVTLEQHNLKIYRKIQEMIKNEVRVENYMTEDAEVIIAAYGTVSRIAKTAIQILRKNGIKAGLVRPISLFPFPYKAFEDIAERVDKILVVEMSLGQMIEDVKLGVCGKAKAYFYGRMGGMVPSYEEIIAETQRLVKEVQ
jgi:2-oxoglutarate ferredoxin oxidoreductase subunit alpha